MNAPAKAAPMREDVTQADREAAAAFLEALGFSHQKSLVDGSLGFKDYHGEKALAIIARHRLAHTARPDAGEVVAKLRDVYGALTPGAIERADLDGMAFAVDDAISYILAITDGSGANKDGAIPDTQARPDAGDEDVERVAQFLHDEGGFGDAMPDRTWPEHPDDTGQREGGWVKIVPSDVQAKFRDVARRLLLPPSLAAMREGVDRGMVEVPREPTEAMLEAGFAASALDWCDGRKDIAEVYEAMIAAGLSSEQPR